MDRAAHEALGEGVAEEGVLFDVFLGTVGAQFDPGVAVDEGVSLGEGS